MSKIDTIKLRNDFLRFFKQSSFYVSKNFVYKYIPGDQKIKTGIVLRRKIGNAVKRNLLRRRIKEIISKNIEHNNIDGLLLLICRHKSCDSDFATIQQDLNKVIERINQSKIRLSASTNS